MTKALWDTTGLLVLYTSLSALVIAFVLFTAPFVLALLTLLRRRQEQQERSALYAGRVWHTRYRPVRHAFEYPLFLFCLDLEECENGRFRRKLWPLSMIMDFRESDHLKNGEGLVEQQDDSDTSPPALLTERILRLVSTRTKLAFAPSLQTHRIFLVTHLCYWGYCFNPVSFYYIRNRETGQTDAVVGEVSNTPWNEMYPYVLHPASVDQVQVTADQASGVVNYVFPKSFHVSPFMEMEYSYDWTFGNLPTNGSGALSSSSEARSIRITTDMRAHSDEGLQFRATVHVHRRNGLHPLRCAWYLASFPVYCAIVQIWIHYEAFWLFGKGVTFQPHPDGTETAASRIIGDLMTPLYAIQDYMWQRGQRTSKEKTS